MNKRPELDTINPPGQIVNRPPEQTLGDYIARKNYHDAFDRVAEEMGLKKKKLTFKEWLKKSSFVEPDETVYCWLEECWKAAQENV